MDEQTLGWCRRLVSCRSVTNEGTRRILELCARELLAPLGIEAELIPSASEGNDQVNLIAKVTGRDSTLAPMVLNTHLDTVPPGDPASWTECGGDPFRALVKNNRIYGLGAADTKLDFIAKVTGLTACGAPLRDVFLVATFGEEHGLVGAKEMTASGRLPTGALAYVGEASHLEVITAHKGLMVFELSVGFEPSELTTISRPFNRAVFQGKSAHSSTPALGRNAILMALDALSDHRELAVLSIAGGDAVNKVPARCELIVGGSATEFRATAFEPIQNPRPGARLIPNKATGALADFLRALRKFADDAGPDEPDYAAPTLTCNPGVLRTVDSALILDFELRPPPSLPLDEVRAGIARIADHLAAGNPTIKVEMTERRANPGFRSDLSGLTVELAMGALARAGLELRTNVKAGCTEAGIYAAAGLKPVVFGPGPSTGVIHAPNEYNLLSEVDEAARFYRELLAS
jgi:acetylornithine deacetylase/succinyl-diaminopimelate desuccinylase-like protein